MGTYTKRVQTLPSRSVRPSACLDIRAAWPCLGPPGSLPARSRRAAAAGRRVLSVRPGSSRTAGLDLAGSWSTVRVLPGLALRGHGVCEATPPTCQPPHMHVAPTPYGETAHGLSVASPALWGPGLPPPRRHSCSLGLPWSPHSTSGLRGCPGTTWGPLRGCCEHKTDTSQEQRPRRSKRTTSANPR